MEKFESDLAKAMRSLKNQRLTVGTSGFGAGRVAADGEFEFQVGGFPLTSAQILALQKQNKLHLQGIKEFALKEKEILQMDIEAARSRVRPEELKAWTAKQICDYINQEFARNHSVGQIKGVLDRLGIEYKKS